MQFGGINTGRYEHGAVPQHPYVFAWPYNNYWVTNFKASEEGDLTWHFSLTSSRNLKKGFAVKFGWGIGVPMYGVVLSGSVRKGIGEVDLLDSLFINSGQGSVLFSSIMPLEEENGILFLLREVEGKKVQIQFSKRYKWYKSDVLGNIRESVESLVIRPFESVFLLLKLE